MKIFLPFLFLITSLNIFAQKSFYISTHIGTIQYYGDLNESKSSIDIRNYFQAKDPLFGFCVGKQLNNYFTTQLIIEGGSLRESKSSMNVAATTSFFQLSQRLEVDVFNLTHPDIPFEKQRFHTNLYLGLGINHFKSFTNEINNNLPVRQAKGTKSALSYGIVFKYKIKPNTTFKLDFGHNKIYTDIFDATIGGGLNETGEIKDKKLSSYQTALDLWAGLRIGIVFDFNKNLNNEVVFTT